MADAADIPRLTEDIQVYDETIQQVWMCEPPEAGISYVVVRDHWNADYTERTIDEIRLIG